MEEAEWYVWSHSLPSAAIVWTGTSSRMNRGIGKQEGKTSLIYKIRHKSNKEFIITWHIIINNICIQYPLLVYCLILVEQWPTPIRWKVLEALLWVLCYIGSNRTTLKSIALYSEGLYIKKNNGGAVGIGLIKSFWLICHHTIESICNMLIVLCFRIWYCTHWTVPKTAIQGIIGRHVPICANYCSSQTDWPDDPTCLNKLELRSVNKCCGSNRLML